MGRIRLLLAFPGTGGSGDVIEMSREEADAWVAAGRAEHVGDQKEADNRPPPDRETTTNDVREGAIRKPARPSTRADQREKH